MSIPPPEPERLAQLERELEGLAQQLLELGLAVHDFQPTTGEVVQAKIEALTTSMLTAHKISEGMQTLVPLELLDLLEDKGANPDAYTKDYLEHVVAENQFARGKLGAFKHFADVLQGDLAEAYPEEAAAYSRITGATKSEAVQEDREESVDVTTIAP